MLGIVHSSASWQNMEISSEKQAGGRGVLKHVEAEAWLCSRYLLVLADEWENQIHIRVDTVNDT